MSTNNKGFTILELVIIVAIVAITAAFAAPGMISMISDNRIIGNANDFIAALQLAKAESAARITPVTICKKNATSDGCAADGDWSSGWIVFVDANANASVDGEQILLNHEALDARITFGGTAQVQAAITYQPSGTTSITSAQMLVMCDERGFVDSSRAVLVTITGRGNVMKASDSGQTTCL